MVLRKVAARGGKVLARGATLLPRMAWKHKRKIAIAGAAAGAFAAHKPVAAAKALYYGARGLEKVGRVARALRGR